MNTKAEPMFKEKEYKPSTARCLQHDISRLNQLTKDRMTLGRLTYLSPDNIRAAIADVEREHQRLLERAHQRLDNMAHGREDSKPH
jgi:hypothetical protein